MSGKYFFQHHWIWISKPLYNYTTFSFPLDLVFDALLFYFLRWQEKFLQQTETVFFLNSLDFKTIACPYDLYLSFRPCSWCIAILFFKMTEKFLVMNWNFLFSQLIIEYGFQNHCTIVPPLPILYNLFLMHRYFLLEWRETIFFFSTHCWIWILKPLYDCITSSFILDPFIDALLLYFLKC